MNELIGIPFFRMFDHLTANYPSDRDDKVGCRVEKQAAANGASYWKPSQLKEPSSFILN